MTQLHARVARLQLTCKEKSEEIKRLRAEVKSLTEYKEDKEKEEKEPAGDRLLKLVNTTGKHQSELTK